MPTILKARDSHITTLRRGGQTERDLTKKVTLFTRDPRSTDTVDLKPFVVGDDKSSRWREERRAKLQREMSIRLPRRTGSDLSRERLAVSRLLRTA